MFSLRAPTQPAKPRMKVTPPTTRTNQTGSNPCSWVTWVRSSRIPCKTKQTSSVNQETVSPVQEFSLLDIVMMRWWAESPFHSTPRNQPQWRPLQPAATDTHQGSDRSNHRHTRPCLDMSDHRQTSAFNSKVVWDIFTSFRLNTFRRERRTETFHKNWRETQFEKHFTFPAPSTKQDAVPSFLWTIRQETVLSLYIQRKQCTLSVSLTCDRVNNWSGEQVYM